MAVGLCFRTACDFVSRNELAVALANLLIFAQDGGGSWRSPVMNIVLIVSSVFLILLVLIQRGKGGGLAGAFGGSGGSSAFGSRAGDTFTRITIYAAAFWLLFVMITIRMTQVAGTRHQAAVRAIPRTLPQ